MHTFESQCDKTYLPTYAPNEDSNLPGHSPSLIRVLRFEGCFLNPYAYNSAEKVPGFQSCFSVPDGQGPTNSQISFLTK